MIADLEKRLAIWIKREQAFSLCMSS